MIAQKLGERFGQSFVVENRSGAGGNIGTDFVAKAKPDGYTLLWANVAPMSISPHLYKKLPYDPVRDFAPITLATVFSNVSGQTFHVGYARIFHGKGEAEFET